MSKGTPLVEMTHRIQCEHCGRAYTGTWYSERCPHCAKEINQENVRHILTQKYEYIENSPFTKVGRGLESAGDSMNTVGSSMSSLGCGMIMIGLVFWLLLMLL